MPELEPVKEEALGLQQERPLQPVRESGPVLAREYLLELESELRRVLRQEEALEWQRGPQQARQQGRLQLEPGLENHRLYLQGNRSDLREQTVQSQCQRLSLRFNLPIAKAPINPPITAASTTSTQSRHKVR